MEDHDEKKSKHKLMSRYFKIRTILQINTWYSNKWIIGTTLMIIGLYLTYTQLFTPEEQIMFTTSHAADNTKWVPSYHYQLTPILDDIKKGKGALINDIDLCEIFETTPSNQVQSLITKIKADVYKYEFIVFKHQCNHKNNNLSPETFAMIASAFGTISHYTSKGHSAEPNDTDITVLSNDPTKGHTLTGAQGWHVDGSNKLSPDGIVFQYVMAAPNKGYGGTQFISSEAMIELMKNTNKELYNRLNRLYMAARNSVKPPRIHPLIGKHPITNKEYMVIHTAFTKQFIQVKDESMIEIDKLFLGQRVDDIFIETYQNDNRIQKIYSKEETQDLLAVILEFIEKDCRENGLIFVTDYDKGDLLIRDNWAMLHTSHPSAHFDVKEVGLRVIWRLTTDGKFIPSKF